MQRNSRVCLRQTFLETFLLPEAVHHFETRLNFAEVVRRLRPRIETTFARVPAVLTARYHFAREILGDILRGTDP